MNWKYVIASILGLIIIGTCTVIIFRGKDFFRQEINITYPDNCVEKYINGMQVSPNCTEGRKMMESKPIDLNNVPINITFPSFNVTPTINESEIIKNLTDVYLNSTNNLTVANNGTV